MVRNSLKDKIKGDVLMNIENQKDIIKDILKKEVITSDGEVVELHEEGIEKLSKQIIKKQAELQTRDNEEKIEGIKIRKEISEFEEMIKETFGKFYFNFYNSLPKDLGDQFKFRFMYMSTYLKHNDDRMVLKQLNGLYRTIKVDELQDILKLERSEFHKTKSELVKNNLISINENNQILINRNISKVGNISKNNKKDYTRIFNNCITELYNNSMPREHKKIFMIIKLLPYIHFQFNIVCKNPYCEIMEDIKPLSIKDIMNEFGMANQSVFKKKLLSIKGKNNKLIMLFEDYDKQMIAINPSVYYRGTQKEALQYLINLFTI